MTAQRVEPAPTTRPTSDRAGEPVAPAGGISPERLERLRRELAQQLRDLPLRPAQD